MVMNRIRNIALIGLGATIVVMNNASIAQAGDGIGTGAGMGYDRAETSYCSGELVANNPKARINVRAGAGLGYTTIHYGMPGDSVDFLSRYRNPSELMVVDDENGVRWYQIGFPASRAYGWVRRDFVRQTECRN